MSYPIISADSHITEPPTRISTTSSRAGRTARRAWSASDDARRRVRHPRHERSRFRWASSRPRASRPRRSACTACRSRSCTAAAGIPRRGSPTRTATASRPRSSTRPSAWCCATTRTSTTRRPASTPTTAGSPSTARAHPDRLLGCGQTAMRTPEEGIGDLEAISAAGPARRDDARQPGRRGLRLARVRRVLARRDRSGHAALVPHPDDARIRTPTAARS